MSKQYAVKQINGQSVSKEFAGQREWPEIGGTHFTNNAENVAEFPNRRSAQKLCEQLLAKGFVDMVVYVR